MATPTEIIAVPIEEKWRAASPDGETPGTFAIHRVKLAPGQADHADPSLPQQFGIKGDSDPDELKAGLSYRFWGTWDNSRPDFGPTFAFSSFSPSTPHGKAGTVAYLKEYCRNVGDAIAHALWDEFGADAVQVLRESPEKAAEAIGGRFGIEKAKEASEDLEEIKAREGLTIELFDLFTGRGFGKGCVRESIRLWGAKAMEVLTRDPYKAMALRGVGWLKADAFYLAMGKDPGRLKRQAYCLSYAAVKEADGQGHVWTLTENAVAGLRATVSGANVVPEKALSLATRGKLLRKRPSCSVCGEVNGLWTKATGYRCETCGTYTEAKWWAAEERRAAAEEYVCHKVMEALYESKS